MRSILPLGLLLCSTSFAQLVPQRPAPLFDHLLEVNKEWRTMGPSLADGDRIVRFKDEADRIATHLHLVGGMLRQRTPEGLGAAPLTARLTLLEDLDRYADRGLFPQNHVLPYRDPIFIDPHHTACAVGQLMIESGHAALAERIGREMNLAYVRDMRWPEIGAWASEHGFTADELAWIQPTYAPPTFWAPLGGGTDGSVTALFNRSNGKLIVAGTFTTAGTTAAARVAEWNGTGYDALGTGVDGTITCAAEFNGQLYLGGSFSFGYSDLAVWDGASWTYENAFVGKYVRVNDLHVYDGELYAAGFAAGFAGNTHQVLKLTGTGWQAVGGPLGTAFNDEVLTLNDLDGSLACGGRFTELGQFGGTPLAHVAHVDGSGNWVELGDGLNATVRDLHMHDGQLYASGELIVDSLPTFGLARIAVGANTWELLLPNHPTYLTGYNAEAHIGHMTTANGELYLGGAFHLNPMLGTNGQNVAHFWGVDGLTALSLVDQRVNTVAPFNNLLVIGGDFTMDAGTPLPFVASTELFTSTPDLGHTSVISLLPDPATDEVVITLDRSPAPGTAIDLIDAKGRVVLGPRPMTTPTMTLDVRSLSAGAYTLRITDASGVRAISLRKH